MGGFDVFHDADELDISHGFLYPVDGDELRDLSSLAGEDFSDPLVAFSEEGDEILGGSLAASFPCDIIDDANFRSVFLCEWLPAFHGF